MATSLPTMTFDETHTPSRRVAKDYVDLNAELNVPGENGEIQFDADKEAAREYHLQVINQNTVFFHDLEEKIKYLVNEGYYDGNVFNQYDWNFVKSLYKKVYSYKHRFPSLLGALKFYNQYALKTYDGSRYLERFEDRVTIIALFLGEGDEEMATRYAEEIITGRFQPATPTFTNSGKAFGGELVSCFLMDVQDNTQSINRVIGDAKQLSKMGGGVGINLSNIRATGDPIQRVENVASGLVPFMKELENTFSWFNQLGTRPGSGAVYVSVHHPDVMNALDTKKENADEKVRIKTLSLGLMITDVALKAASSNEDIYQFSPYDIQQEYGVPFTDISVTDMYQELIENPNIRKTKINARKFFKMVAEIQFESGYPYLIFEDSANRQHNTKNVGRIKMSNLCSEILQPQTPSTFRRDGWFDEVGQDISCNLASLNITKVIENGDKIGDTVGTAVRALTTVSEKSNIEEVPSVRNGNSKAHAIGLGAMNLHGFLASNKIIYGSFEALDFVNIYFSTVMFHALKESNKIAEEKGQKFDGFEGSSFDTGEFFEPFVNARFSVEDEDKGGHDLFIKTDRIKELLDGYGFEVPTREDWEELEDNVHKHGLYNRNLIAIAPTGSISFVNHSTMSIHPVAQPVVVRKEGKLGRVYWASPGMTNDNAKYYTSAYDLGVEAVVETYNTAAPFIDQGASQTWFVKQENSSTKTLNANYIKAWNGTKTFHGNDYEGANTPWDGERRRRLGATSKSIYYVRVSQDAIAGSEIRGINDMIECVGCQI